MKITREEFDKLYSDDISVKDYDRIINLINERGSDIVMLIQPTITKNGWFVYSNYNYHNENDEGFFDPDDYENEICYSGEFSFPAPYCLTDEGLGYIPTRWLWTDDDKILEEFHREVEKAKNKKTKEKELAKQTREELKIKKEKFKQLIKSKLTKEELKYISFK